jgi:hypothetical protein
MKSILAGMALLNWLLSTPAPLLRVPGGDRPGRRKAREPYSRLRREARSPHTPEQRAVQRMTNWQRHQWMRAGADIARAEEFARLARRA